ncbi:MAG: LysE family translocator [Limimaricola sp.]|uniref:LysE family translocator n=1 Tax=Limimaricola sp. TaxID=2211665 RepID=UPI001D7F6D72|nr:LysE family translocator [Limimaricola sp.]MBI1417408.1 LysE family translocator [Limimaricola sp.]
MIVDPLTLATFVPLALALNLTPGADMLFCLAQGMRGGARPALAAAAGVSLASMVNVALAGLGLGALIAAEPRLFAAIRWAGVAYLLWLGWKTWHSGLARADAPPVRPSRALRDGMLVNLSNPKVIFFILAFIPQFVDPARGPILPQFLVLGAIPAIGGFLVNGTVGAFAGSIGRALARDVRIERVLRRVSASVFGLLAVKLAPESHPS